MTITAIADGIALYRVFGENDLLLYIGISNNFGQRWKQHAKKQPWWDEMRRLTVDCWYPSRDDAEEAETAAISAESPKYNIRGAAKAQPVCVEAEAYDTMVAECDRAMHSLWHDGFSRARALQEAIGRYAAWRDRDSELTLMVKARSAVHGNWKRRADCALCQRGFTRQWRLSFNVPVPDNAPMPLPAPGMPGATFIPEHGDPAEYL